jgi:hypothetical protein
MQMIDWWKTCTCDVCKERQAFQPLPTVEHQRLVTSDEEVIDPDLGPMS